MEHDYGLIGGNIFHGELSTDQLFHMRPAPGYADFTHADRRPVPVLVGHPRRRRRHRHPRRTSARRRILADRKRSRLAAPAVSE